MKKLFGLLLVSAAVSLTACAQKIDAAKVPAPVKESFAKQFPGANAKWEKENGSYEAGFKHQGHEMSALFDAKGVMSESEMEIKASELPAAVSAYLKTNHPGNSIKEAAKITKANGEVQYEAEVKGKDLIFDAAGKFLKEVKE